MKISGSAKFSGSISGNEINLDEGFVYEERLVKNNTVQENTGFRLKEYKLILAEYFETLLRIPITLQYDHSFRMPIS